jgi:hypothetical protein
MFLHPEMTAFEAKSFLDLAKEQEVDFIALPGKVFYALLLLAHNEGWVIRGVGRHLDRAKVFKLRSIKFTILNTPT